MINLKLKVKLIAYSMEKRKKKFDVRLIDRSFTNLGYIGFGDGICLEELD